MAGRTRRVSALCALLVFGLVATGCAERRDERRPEGRGVSPADGKDINEVERDRLRDGGTLTWPLDQLPPNFNAGHLDGTLGDNASVVGALLPGPFDYDAAAQPSLNTDFVESAELTETDPKQVVTYRINPRATWYAGTPITVEDFEAHWRARNGSDSRFVVASTQGYDKVESVTRGGDEREVIVTFRERYADWRGLFSGLYPASTNRDPEIFNRGWRERPLTSAGPFRFEGIDRTAQTITLVRNERWWGRPAKLDRIVYRVSDPDAQVDALATGEIDFIDVGPDVNQLQRAQATPGIDLRTAAGPNFRHITFNGTSPVLQDLRVRRAVAQAIDRGTIARALIGPLGVPATPLGNHIFMTNQKGYQDNSGEVGRYDPQRSRALLDEAGWKLAGAVRAKEGRDLVLRFVIPSQVATSEQEAELVQGMLADVGVKVIIETVPTANFFKDHITPGNFDVTVFSWLGTVFPVSSSKSIYARPQAGPGGQLEIRQNYARIGSDELDRLFDQATATFDPDETISLGNRIDAMIWEEVHSLTLYQRPEIVAARAELANFGAFGFATGRYEDIGFVRA